MSPGVKVRAKVLMWERLKAAPTLGLFAGGRLLDFLPGVESGLLGVRRDRHFPFITLPPDSPLEIPTCWIFLGVKSTLSEKKVP